MHNGSGQADVPISGFAVAGAILGSLAWIFMLTFTVGGREYGLLPSGEVRLMVGGFFATLSLIFSLVSLSPLRAGIQKGWFWAGVGVGVSSAVLLIVVPVLLLMMING